MAPDGSLVVIELKRDQTPWAVVAQALDYASWVEQLEAGDIADIYRRFTEGRDLAEDFKVHSGADLDEDQLNQTHQIIIVAADLDDSTERITRYLSERGVPINVLFFRVFENGDEKLLSRAWLVDPDDAEVEAVGAGKGQNNRLPWNGEYYVAAAARWHGFDLGILVGQQNLLHRALLDPIAVHVDGVEDALGEVLLLGRRQLRDEEVQEDRALLPREPRTARRTC